MRTRFVGVCARTYVRARAHAREFADTTANPALMPSGLEPYAP